jgi:hypothetical protein
LLCLQHFPQRNSALELHSGSVVVRVCRGTDKSGTDTAQMWVTQTGRYCACVAKHDRLVLMSVCNRLLIMRRCLIDLAQQTTAAAVTAAATAAGVPNTHHIRLRLLPHPCKHSLWVAIRRSACPKACQLELLLARVVWPEHPDATAALR